MPIEFTVWFNNSYVIRNDLHDSFFIYSFWSFSENLYEKQVLNTYFNYIFAFYFLKFKIRDVS